MTIKEEVKFGLCVLQSYYKSFDVISLNITLSDDKDSFRHKLHLTHLAKCTHIR